MKMQEWKEVKLFISSTFNDMHAERDYLVTEVYPELREWCEARRLYLTDIDLRWGVSEDQPETEDTVRTCLRCIDECRPFFLCFVGQRRGWVPDLQKYAAGETEYEGLGAYLDRFSMTEIEIEHAALAPMMHVLSSERKQMDKCQALFFFRENPFYASIDRKCILTDAQRKIYTNASMGNENEEDEKLEALRQRIQREWPVNSYDCRWDTMAETEELRSFGDVCHGRLTDFSCNGKPLRDTILSTLKSAIEKEYPEHVPVFEPDLYDEDALEQHLFAQTSCLDFTGRHDDLNSIRAYAGTDTTAEVKAFFLYGEEGTGKTALLSKLWDELQKAGKKVVFRSCGVTAASASEMELYLSIGNECGLFRASEKDPASRKQIDTAFLSAMLEKGFDTLILDGADNLTNCSELRHIDSIPEGFCLIVSSSRRQDIDYLRFPKTVLEISDISDMDERIHMVKTFLKRSLKTLSNEQMNLLVSSDSAGNPMYLKTVCSELISYGSFADLNYKIRSYGSSVEDAFYEVLRTIENECEGNKRVFPALIGLLCFSRGGLDENELLRALEELGYKGGETKYRANMILRRLRPYLSRANGRFDIMPNGFRKATRQHYVEHETRIRRALINVYTQNLQNAQMPLPNKGVIEVHGSRELLMQYAMLKDRDGIAQILKDETMLNRIPPDVYFSEYKNGVFYACDFDSDPGYGSGSTLLAELFLEKAIACKNEIGKSYPHPYRPKYLRLKECADQTEAFRFRDLFYETTQYASASMRLIVCAAKNVRSLEEYADVKAIFQKLSASDGGIFSLMNYLSDFGADETGLSHQVEDLAFGALLSRRKADEILSKMPEIKEE